MDRFLLLRADDQLLLGVAWSGFTPAGDPPVLVAGADATIVLTLPPQHVGEEVAPGGGAAPRAVLAGPSRLAFAVEPGVRLSPTAAGILALVAGLGVLPSAEPADAWQTAVELPWRFVVSPGPGAVAAHPADPVTAVDVSGLWRTRLTAADGLRLVPVDRRLAETDDPFPVPAHRDLRTRLHREATRTPAAAEHLELSPIGGTLRASGAWQTFRWAHEAVLGRDMRVETVTGGALFPTGHRAVVTELVQRVVPDRADNTAVLRRVRVLSVHDPVRPASGDPRARRAWPFDAVVLEQQVYPIPGDVLWQRHPFPGGDVDAYFRPLDEDGRPLTFPVRCEADAAVVHLRLPLIFVADLLPGADSLADAGLARRLAALYGSVRVPLPGLDLDLARSARPRDGDRHEVHEVAVNGVLADGYRPVLTELTVALPALRVLVEDDTHRVVRYTEAFLAGGDDEDVLLELADPDGAIGVGFAGHAERGGGLAVPQFAGNALSRTFGPVRLDALPDAAGLVPSRAVLGAEASLFGVPLLDLVEGRMPQPLIVALPGQAVAMRWEGVRLRPSGPFVFDGHSALSVTATRSGDGVTTTCVLERFSLLLPLGRPQLRLTFAAVRFTQEGTAPPRLRIDGLAATFLNELQLLEALGDAVELSRAGLTVTASPAEVTAAYRLALPEVSAGAFVLRGIALRAGVTVPFDRRPVSVRLGFASREAPFTLTVLMFGGGGYVDVELDHTGLRRMEAALEFGALIAMNFVVATAEVHALGGVRYVLAADGSVALDGYLRIGGCVDVLGLVSVSVELCVTLSYRSATKALVGRATLVVEVDLTLWSQRVELDSGDWVLAGGSATAATLHGAGGAPPPALPPDDGLRRWRAYRAAFAGPEPS